MLKKTPFLIIILAMLLTLPTIYSYQLVPSEELSLTCPSPSIRTMIDQINASELVSYIGTISSFGCRYTGTENCSRAADWIYDTFEKMGVSVSFHHWQYAGFTSKNVVATIPGTDCSSTVEYLLTAHYDTTQGSVGANDDGSGVAAVLAIAKIMSQYSFQHTIRFIAFSAEEIGTYGSFCYARDAYRNNDNIRAVINPDIIGDAYTEEGGNNLRFFYPQRSKWLAEYAQNIGKQYYDEIGLYVEMLPNYIGADHQSFIDYGYDGVWVAQHDPSPHVHTANDTIENINKTYLTKSTKLLLAVIAQLAIEPVELQICFQTPYEGYFYMLGKPLLSIDLGKQWYAQMRGMTFVLGSALASVIVYSNDEISSVIFCIDGNFIIWDSFPSYEWYIQGKHFPLIGRHVLQAFVFTKNGTIATDEMEIYILSLSCQYN